MKCHKCGTKFPANLAVSGTGGQEAPGTFLVITVVLVIVGITLRSFGVKYWDYVALGSAVIVAVQIVVAFFDCRNSDCPTCKTPARVRPWSM